MRFSSLLLLAGLSLSILIAVPALFTPRAWAQDDESDMPCRATETGRALDFWIGSWDVTDEAGMHYGTNRVEWDAAGCAVHEYWENAEGGRGTSLFYFAIHEDTWHQVWVTGDTSKPWGLKLKELIEIFDDGSVRFQGELTSAEGETYLDRTTLTPNDNGTVRQFIEVSMDGGTTWRPGFDAIYVPAVD